MWNKIKTLILSWFGFKRKPFVAAAEKDVKVVTKQQESVSAKQKTVPMTPAGSVIKQLKRTHRKNPTYS